MFSTADAAAYLNLSKAEIFRLRESGDFPAPVHLDKSTVRFRETDIRLFEAWLLARSVAEKRGENPDNVPRPDYSLPLATDSHAMARERLCASCESASDIEPRVDQVRNEAWNLVAEAAILASQSKPGQLSEESMQKLRDTIPTEVADAVLEELSHERAQRLREVLGTEV